MQIHRPCCRLTEFVNKPPPRPNLETHCKSKLSKSKLSLESWRKSGKSFLQFCPPSSVSTLPPTSPSFQALILTTLLEKLSSLYGHCFPYYQSSAKFWGLSRYKLKEKKIQPGAQGPLGGDGLVVTMKFYLVAGNAAPRGSQLSRWWEPNHHDEINVFSPWCFQPKEGIRVNLGWAGSWHTAGEQERLWPCYECLH